MWRDCVGDRDKATGGEQRHLRIGVIGAGVAGMAAVIKLRQAGFHDLVVYEKAEEVGGTWRENRYPGVACDVPSHHYAFTFEPNSEWSHRLAHGSELQKYMIHVSDKYDIRRDIRFGEEVVDARFDGHRWHLRTKCGTTDVLDAIVACCGYLHIPNTPTIPGQESFKGESFHSACWPDGPDFAGKKVALVGNGSTGVQIASVLGEAGISLEVFQRSPQWVFPLPNREIGTAEKKMVGAIPWIGKLSSDFYQWFFEKVFAVAVIRDGWQRKFLSGMCRLNLKRIKDPALRKALTPDYQPLCRRMVMSYDFYGAIQLPNVSLVTDGIARIEPEGIITEDGKLHACDVIVFATGFHAHNYIRPIELVTDRGARLTDEWAEQPRAFLGIHMAKFPNVFLVGGPSSPLGNFSATAFSEAIIDRIVVCLSEMREENLTRYEVTEKAVDDYYDWLKSSMPGTIWVSGCKSWYLGKDGFPSNNFPATPDTFRDMLKDVDRDDFLIEQELSGNSPPHVAPERWMRAESSRQERLT